MVLVTPGREMSMNFLGMLISFFPEIDFCFEKNGFFFRLSNLVLCVAHSTAAAVTLCARPYIAAARKRTTDVRNGIRGQNAVFVDENLRTRFLILG